MDVLSPAFKRPQNVTPRIAPEAEREAKLTDVRFHDLRHTCAAWLVQAGVPMAEARNVLGHCTLAMTERYAHLAPENFRVAVALLDSSKSRLGHGDPETKKEAS